MMRFLRLNAVLAIVQEKRHGHGQRSQVAESVDKIGSVGHQRDSDLTLVVRALRKASEWNT